tara:strand:- start:659 stop:1114 length:456 start_codon:yes stop_codon:yes gene_type:complete
MPFQFSLESVLRLREEAVERAKDQLAVEMVQMNQAQQQVDEVNARIEQAREAFRESMSNGTDSGLVVQLRQFMVSLESERENRQMTLEGYQARVETCQKALLSARRKLDTIESIRVRRLKEYEYKERQDAQKQLDELVVQGVGNGMEMRCA